MFSRTVQPVARQLSAFAANRICIAPEVEAALKSSKGVVALESTVITHGLPRPHNLLLAKKLEETVRANDAVPATIALLDGKVHIGLNGEQLQRVAEDVNSVKVSKRDIPVALVTNLVGGTTVAATMYLANLVGIRVFATGGLGGVHRGASETFDISADLLELGRTPVVVVCAGVKSILDIPKTLEFLETNSVNVLVYGKSNKFPGFFTPETESKVPFHTTSLQEIVDLVDCSRAVGLKSGCVVACPIPAEQAAHGEEIEKAIQEALQESLELKITSQNVTPFILKRVSELTKGASLKTNIALLENNAIIGAELAKLFARSNDPPRKKQSKAQNVASAPDTAVKKTPSIVVVGATILDFETITQCDVKHDGGSYAGRIVHRCGGVGRNHADALTRLGNDVKFISAVGNDLFGDCFKKECAHMNLEHVITVDDVPTAAYLSSNVKGNVLFGISAIGEIIGKISPELIKSKESLISSADFIVLDGNITVPTIRTCVELAHCNKVKTWFEPTDIAKMRKLFDAGVADLIAITSPNLNEFLSYCNQIGEKLPARFAEWEPEKMFDFLSKNPSSYLRSLDTLIVTLGPKGTIILQRVGNSVRLLRRAAPISSSEIISVSGAGDCFNSGFLTGLLHNLTTERILQLAQKSAETSLRSVHAVPEELRSLQFQS